MNDDPKRLILARRARFVAAAFAGIAAACGKDKADPGPCLSIAYQAPDGGIDASSPRPCLSPPARLPDGGKVQCTCPAGDPLCSCL